MRTKILAIVFASALLLGGAVPIFGGGTASAVQPTAPNPNACEHSDVTDGTGAGHAKSSVVCGLFLNE